MWSPALHAALITAASDTAPSGTGGDQLVIIIGGIVVAAITAAGTVLVAVVNSRSNRTAPAPPDPAVSRDATGLHEDVAVLRYRADDNDERDDVQDRRLDQIERQLDLDNPSWRHSRDPRG